MIQISMQLTSHAGLVQVLSYPMFLLVLSLTYPQRDGGLSQPPARMSQEWVLNPGPVTWRSAALPSRFWITEYFSSSRWQDLVSMLEKYSVIQNHENYFSYIIIKLAQVPWTYFIILYYIHIQPVVTHVQPMHSIF